MLFSYIIYEGFPQSIKSLMGHQAFLASHHQGKSSLFILKGSIFYNHTNNIDSKDGFIVKETVLCLQAHSAIL